MNGTLCFECHSLAYRMAVAREEHRWSDLLKLNKEREKHEVECFTARLYLGLWPNSAVAEKPESE